jgi:hypothetical protein
MSNTAGPSTTSSLVVLEPVRRPSSRDTSPCATGFCQASGGCAIVLNNRRLEKGYCALNATLEYSLCGVESQPVVFQRSPLAPTSIIRRQPVLTLVLLRSEFRTAQLLPLSSATSPLNVSQQQLSRTYLSLPSPKEHKREVLSRQGI